MSQSPETDSRSSYKNVSIQRFNLEQGYNRESTNWFEKLNQIREIHSRIWEKNLELAILIERDKGKFRAIIKDESNMPPNV